MKKSVVLKINYDVGDFDEAARYYSILEDIKNAKGVRKGFRAWYLLPSDAEYMLIKYPTYVRIVQ